MHKKLKTILKTSNYSIVLIIKYIMNSKINKQIISNENKYSAKNVDSENKEKFTNNMVSDIKSDNINILEEQKHLKRKLKSAVGQRYIKGCLNILSNKSFIIEEYEFLTHFLHWNGKNKRYIRLFDINFRRDNRRLSLCAFMNIYNCIVSKKFSEINMCYRC